MCTSGTESEAVLENSKADLAVRARLGKRIRALRRENGWSQHRLAASCGIHVSHLSKLERGGANATLSTLLGVATTLNVTISDLFRGIS
ncbi:MAG TPA: helix-turn-helix transcriptional regulator [Candidatus Angelobacter sp.]|nr:helix-turn-helix transcriptional regulator [Candidatus Angelobacter sp.]